MRTILVLLCIATVLICPYDCAVKYVVARDRDDGNPAACCEHCQSHTVPVPLDDSAPSAPTPNEDSRCCFCEGAVFDAARGAFEDFTPLSTWLGGIELDVQTSVTWSRAEVFGLPPPLDGRRLRIAICSLRQ